MSESIHSEKTCSNCQLRKNGRCCQLSNDPCSDYRALPYISAEERANWPSFGDATYFRLSSGPSHGWR